MKLNRLKLGLLLLVSLVTINIASAHPGFTIDVKPISSTVNTGGGTAIYSVTTTAIAGLSQDEFADLSVTIVDPNGNPVNWDTTFSENSLVIGPNSPETTVTMQVQVPPGTSVGDYLLTVNGNGYLPDPSDPTKPDTTWIVESSNFPLTVSVTSIPEFPTIALPVISVLGLVFMVSRRKGDNS
jgi:uncharacterized membrane protein